MIAQKIWTYSIQNAFLSIDANFSLTKLSIVLMSGSGSVVGSEICNGLASQPIDLVVGMPILVTGDGSTPIADYVIDCSSGGVIALIGVK